MNGYKREFRIHLIESTSGTAPLPKLEFDASISMSKSVFEKVLGDISVVADQVAISALKEGVSFGGKSDIGAATIQLDKNGADVLEMDVKAEAKASYNIDYFLSISKALGSTAETVTAPVLEQEACKADLQAQRAGCGSILFPGASHPRIVTFSIVPSKYLAYQHHRPKGWVSSPSRSASL